MRLADGHLSPQDSRIVGIQKILEKSYEKLPRLGFLKETSIKGYSHLQDIVHLPFAARRDGNIIHTQESAEEFALFLWKFITEGNWWKIAKTALKKEVLLQHERGTFALPHSAAVSGSSELFAAVIDTCKQGLSGEEYKNLLKYIGTDDFSLLQYAALSTNQTLFLQAIDECKKELPAEDFSTLLNHVTRKGFSLPHDAAKSGDEIIFKRAMDESPLAEVLQERPAGFTLMHTVVGSGNIEMFTYADSKITEICGKEECLKQLTEVAENRYTAAGTAARNGNAGLATLIRSRVNQLSQELGIKGGRY